MITVDTVQSLHDGGYVLAGHCARCGRWGALDLAAMIAAGRAYVAYRWGGAAGSVVNDP